MKKIALVVDVDNWCFNNIAKAISKRLSHIYEFKIIPMQTIDDNIVKLWLIVQDYDLVHFFWRGHTHYPTGIFFEEYIKSLGGDKNSFMDKYVNNKIISTDVYDHLFIEGEDFELTKSIFSNVKHYFVSSNLLMNIYNDLDIKFKPEMVITDGVDLKKFYPVNLDRFNYIEQREIVIGWVGNSAWQDEAADFKGVNTILKPAIKELQEEGYKVVEYFADKQVRFIPHDKMCDYYSKIDLYICTSLMEGTPNPVLESMACGIPIISTSVGIVPDALGENQKEMILEERTKECLKEKIRLLINNPYKFKEYSQENLKQIKNWTWDKISEDFRNFFDNIFQSENSNKK